MSTSQALSQKTLVMIVGPSAIGKSTLMNEIVKMHADFAYVQSFTTRPPREGEQSHYQFTDNKTAKRLHETGQTITYLEHPTTRDIYGTTPESYKGKYNLLDTLSTTVASYRELPFKKAFTIALTAPAPKWQGWFLSRYPQPTPEAEKRLNEAVLSINWALNDPETYWIINAEGVLSETAQSVITTIMYPPAEHAALQEPYAMLEQIRGGIWPKK